MAVRWSAGLVVFFIFALHFKLAKVLGDGLLGTTWRLGSTDGDSGAFCQVPVRPGQACSTGTTFCLVVTNKRYQMQRHDIYVREGCFFG